MEAAEIMTRKVALQGHAIVTDEPDGLNKAQIHLLQMLAHIKTDQALSDFKRLVRTFYAQQVQIEANKYWAEGKIGEHLLNEHLRTPYK